MIIRSICGGNLAVGLLKSGSRGLWSGASWNLGAPKRYIKSRLVAKSAANASRSIWEYLFFVSVSVRLTVRIGWNPSWVFWNQPPPRPCGLPSQMIRLSRCGWYGISTGAVVRACLSSSTIQQRQQYIYLWPHGVTIYTC